MNKTWINWWLMRFEDEIFVKTMLTKYLKNNNLWDSSWEEIIGVKFHYKENEFMPEYDEFDGDFFECFILTNDEKLAKKCFLFTDFLTWDENRD